MTFFLPCIPPSTTHHAKRIVKRGKYASLADTPRLVSAKSDIDSHLWPHRPDEPTRGAVCLSLVFTWPWTSAHRKADKALGRCVKVTKPDVSNLAKTLEDRLVRLGFIDDDAKVVSLTVEKWHGDVSGIDVSIESVAHYRRETA